MASDALDEALSVVLTARQALAESRAARAAPP